MDTTTGQIYFNTDRLPERDRFPAFCEGIFRHVIGADIAKIGTVPFSGSLLIRRAGAVCVADISFSGADMMREAKHVGDGNDAIVLQLWRYGQRRFTQGRHEVSSASNVGIIIDNAKPARIRTASASRFWTLTLPRDRIGVLAAEAVRSNGAALHPSPAFRLLLGYLSEIGPDDLGDTRAAELVGDHLIDLAAFALGGDGSARAGQAGVRAANRAAVLRAIEHRSDDPELSAVSVAQALGITPRYVHLLLEETGRSFTHHVLTRRLERAAALLRDPWSQRRKIADIAGESGFTDLSYFSRAFRRYFGATPSDMRCAALQETEYAR
jgi:AraC-like DNA-binding protein